VETSVREALAPELEVVRRLGGSSRAAVFVARDPALRRLVAVKVLLPARARQEKARARFFREARAVARISHPNVVALHQIGTLPGEVPYVVMRYVRGESLADRLADRGRLPVPEALTILVGVASALEAAHSREILHRDVAPENVLVDEATGEALLADFGLALLLEDAEGDRLTTQGRVVGNIRYLSPEQLRGADPSPMADIWGFGVLAWEALAGRGPFDGTGVRDQVRATLTAEPGDIAVLCPGLSGEVRDALSRCLAKDPRERPSAAELVRVLGQARTEASARGEEAAPRAGQERLPMPHAGDDVLELRVLGGLDLGRADGSPVGGILSQPKRSALLVYLAAEAWEVPVRRDSLVGLFWPDLEQDRGRHALRQALYVLRQALGPDVLLAHGDDDVRVDSKRLRSDVGMFERAAASGDAASAMRWYGGDLLPGFYVSDALEFERWMERERLRLRRLAADCAWSLSVGAEDAGEPTEAARWAQMATDLTPYDEAALHRLVSLLDRIGDRGGAIQAFEHFARRLDQEYAALPSPLTLELIGRVRGGS
jgi:serine/threonine-protein kinase